MAQIYGIRLRKSANYFYIGSTKYEASERLEAHLSAARNGKHPNRHFQNKLKKHKFDVVVDVLREVDDREQFVVEAEMIKSYVDSGVKLVNKIHNGVNFDVLNYREDYAERHYRELTPEKFWAGYRMAYSDTQEKGLAAAMKSVMRSLFEALISRYPDEVREQYGWELD